ncbi:Chromosome partitioning protein MipZ [Rickettsiales bacterium Ac37b]|nr:Chromosome partitioning protein MipZ [Rickettsiales bacterium Ac37b]
MVHVITIGNEKGGAGKTTSAMHLISSLLWLGFKVASIDTDCRQLSLSRYIENRKNTCIKKNISLPLPEHYITTESKNLHIPEKEKEEEIQLVNLINKAQNNDFIVIDTPGSNSYLSRIAHSYADTIITPINDSFVDLDVLAKVSIDQYKIEQPAIYSQMVWEQKMVKAKRSETSINWVVMRNRLSNLNAKNKRNIGSILGKLSQRIGFRIIPGFGERVIFRELFLHGLTLLDIRDNNYKILNIQLNMSHIAARNELRNFVTSLEIPLIDQILKPVKKAIGEKV